MVTSGVIYYDVPEHYVFKGCSVVQFAIDVLYTMCSFVAIITSVLTW